MPSARAVGRRLVGSWSRTSRPRHGRRFPGRGGARTRRIWSTTWASSAPSRRWRSTTRVAALLSRCNVLSGVRLTRALPPADDRTAAGAEVQSHLQRLRGGHHRRRWCTTASTRTALLAVSRGYAKAASGTGVPVNSVTAAPDEHGRRGGLRCRAGRPTNSTWTSRSDGLDAAHRPNSPSSGDRAPGDPPPCAPARLRQSRLAPPANTRRVDAGARRLDPALSRRQPRPTWKAVTAPQPAPGRPTSRRSGTPRAAQVGKPVAMSRCRPRRRPRRCRGAGPGRPWSGCARSRSAVRASSGVFRIRSSAVSGPAA